MEPLLAYDLNGVLIEPQYYMKRLDGATVILRFELSHHLICKQGKPPVDTFSARVVQIRVILPPPGAAPATPRKKRVLPRDNYFGSFTPTKRARDDEDDDKENDRPRKLMRFAVSCVLSHCSRQPPFQVFQLCCHWLFRLLRLCLVLQLRVSFYPRPFFFFCLF